ncbi:baculoviral IAP repeat-containing protein 1-like isoform X1 [Pleurodeles waltl]
MATKAISTETKDLSEISELFEEDICEPPMVWTFENIDYKKICLLEEEEFKKTRKQLQRHPAYNHQMRSEFSRLKSFVSWPDVMFWSPQEMASAGFSSTGLNNSIQCFCCGLVLCVQRICSTPLSIHKKIHPACDFIQGKEVGNIPKYEVHVQIMEDNEPEGKHIYTAVKQRLDSFKNWPFYAKTDPETLARAGFFFTGQKDTVQCFSCKGCLGNWEESDDPWKEHAKWFPECVFLRSEKTESDIKQYIQDYHGFKGVTGKDFISRRTEGILPRKAETPPDTEQCSEDVRSLHLLLTQLYVDASFTNISSFGDSTGVVIDLASLFGDQVIVTKDTNCQRIKMLTFPEVLSELESITMIEGEAGSGKTALLRKIAILWASGDCPMLNRFRLVFYLSLSSTIRGQCLSDMINKELLKSTGALTEVSLKEIIQCQKNQVLFLFDDYGERESIPEIIEEIIHKNHINKVSVCLAARSSCSGSVRKNANTVLNFLKFPLYSTIYMLKNLFSHNLKLVRAFSHNLAASTTLQAAFATPLCVVVSCASWVQYPGAQMFRESNIFKSYLMYTTFKVPAERKKAKDVTALCGELALEGVFKSRFDFSEEDLSEAGITDDDALRIGLLNKFTAQRLRPIFRFYNPQFQEFLAAVRMCELLASEEQELLEKGFHYLRQIDTFLKIVGQYHFLLTYATGIPSKATHIILSHLLKLIDDKAALETPAGDQEHLQHHPEQAFVARVLTMVMSQNFAPALRQMYLLNLLLDFALNAYESHTDGSSVATIILEFLKGKTLSFDPTFSFDSSKSILKFIGNHPESLTLLSSIDIYFKDYTREPVLDIPAMKACFPKLDPQTIGSDYSLGLDLGNELLENYHHLTEQINQFSPFLKSNVGIKDSFVRPFISAQGYQVKLMKIEANQHKPFSEGDCRNLEVLLRAARHIELHLYETSGFVESIKPAIEHFRDSFIKCHIQSSQLNYEEQNTILLMTSMESLAIHSEQDAHIPERILTGLDQFTCLKELYLKLHNDCMMPGEIFTKFNKCYKLEKLTLQRVWFGKEGSSRLIECLQTCKNLRVFHLECGCFNNFEELINALSNCENLEEIRLKRFFQHKEIIPLGAALPRFQSLKVLDLSDLQVMFEDISGDFARALGSLVNLEELRIPFGNGIKQVTTVIIQQLQRLPFLRILKFHSTLTDESVVQLAHAAKDGYLMNLETLHCILCEEITESGWREFFQTLDNLPNLKELNIGKTSQHLIKAHATTVTEFVRCISRLPSITDVITFGLLFDEEDIAMFNSMKERHPQAKNMMLVWRLM